MRARPSVSLLAGIKGPPCIAGEGCVFPEQAAYLAGLFAAFAASTITHLGQPALLYIVPFMLGAVGAVALKQGELGKVLDYKEAPTDSPFSALNKPDDSQ